MEREEWLEARKRGIGGSDTPVVLGISPFKTKMELWREKIGLEDDAEATPAMKRGTALEPVAAALYQEMTGRKLRRSNQILVHPEHDWMLGNVDRMIVSENGKGPGVLEIKCPGLHVFNKCKREGLPAHYNVQLSHYMAVTGRKWGAFAVFNAEKWEMIFFDVDRDQEMINIITTQDFKFWQCVLKREAPEPEIIDTDLIKSLPPVEPVELVTMDSPQWKEAVERLREAQELKKEAESIEEEVKKEIQSIMVHAGAHVAEGSGARIYWKLQDGRETVDYKRLVKDHPEIDVTPYIKKGNPFKTFRPYFIGGTINE